MECFWCVTSKPSNPETTARVAITAYNGTPLCAAHAAIVALSTGTLPLDDAKALPPTKV